MKEKKDNYIDYSVPINFIKIYHGKKYKGKDQWEDLPDEDRRRYEKISEYGNSALGMIKKIGELCKGKFEFDEVKEHDWLEQPNRNIKGYRNIKDELWIELKYRADNRCESISIFVEMDDNNEAARYRVSLELNDSDARKGRGKNQKEALRGFHNHFDYPFELDGSIEYMIRKKGDKKSKICSEDKYIIKEKINNRSYEKAQPSIIIIWNDKQKNDDLETTILNAVDKLIPCYRYVLSVGASMRNCDNINKGVYGAMFNDIEFDKNIILYGPPGTGKTRYTAIYAALICGLDENFDELGKLKDEKTLDILINSINDNDQLYEKVFNCYKVKSNNIVCVNKECININNVNGENELKKIYEEYNNKGGYCHQVNFVTFHQSYSYEEFIEGIKPEVTENKVAYKYKDGIFKTVCKVAKENPEKNFVFIIDEINRGNISKIFGELITSIEDSRRYKFEKINNSKDESLEITLPYTNDRFVVPDNVYIIGTMNTADRSIALIDTALRRRFSFKEMIPKHDMLNKLNIKNNSGDEIISIADVLEKINQRVEVLLDREHTIGHAYFTHLLRDNSAKYVDIKEIGNVFKNKIIPLLQEYFYDDYEYIALTLGEDINSIEKKKGNEEFNIIVKKPDNINLLFNSKNNDKLLGVKPVYTINEKAFYNFETYRQMVGIQKTSRSDDGNTENENIEKENAVNR